MRSPHERELDVAAFVAAFRQRIAVACPGQLALATRYASALTPPKWTLEWYLPQWLSHRFGLEAELTRELTLSNLLGLVAVRLEDDLLDGDMPASETAGAEQLVVAAFDEALAVYRERLDPGSPFWGFLERSMATWRAGADGSDAPTRGAPIKIAAFACCLLAERMADWPSLERCLDHAMSALVAYDQFCDWEEDLSAGRWNTFVAAVSRGQQGPAERDRNRAAVLTAMLTRDVIDEHFRRIAAEAEDAAALASELGLQSLRAYLVDWAARSAAQGAEVARHYRSVADRATQLMFGTAIGGPG